MLCHHEDLNEISRTYMKKLGVVACDHTLSSGKMEIWGSTELADQLALPNILDLGQMRDPVSKNKWMAPEEHLGLISTHLHTYVLVYSHSHMQHTHIHTHRVGGRERIQICFSLWLSSRSGSCTFFKEKDRIIPTSDILLWVDFFFSKGRSGLSSFFNSDSCTIKLGAGEVAQWKVLSVQALRLKFLSPGPM